MYKLVIIEDEFFAANHIKSIAEAAGYKVVKTFHKVEDFNQTQDLKFDIALIDIMLAGNETGIEVGSKLSLRKIPFIYLTANKESHILKSAVKTKPVSYLTKPFNKNDIIAAIALAENYIQAKIRIRTSKGTELLNISDIVFIQSDNVYIHIHTKENKFTQRKLLKEVEAELPDYFSRCHRSYIVNTKSIISVDSKSVNLASKKLPLSQSFKSNFSHFIG